MTLASKTEVTNRIYNVQYLFSHDFGQIPSFAKLPDEDVGHYQFFLSLFYTPCRNQFTIINDDKVFNSQSKYDKNGPERP